MLHLVLDFIKDLYEDKHLYDASTQELIENLACTVEHFEKSVS